MVTLLCQSVLHDSFSEDISDPLEDLKCFVDRLDNQTDFQLEQFKGVFDDDSDDDSGWNDETDLQKLSSDFLSYAQGNENIVASTNSEDDENKISTASKALVTRSRSNSLKTPRGSQRLKTPRNILTPRDKNVFDFQDESVSYNHILKQEINCDFDTIEYSLSDMLDAILADDHWETEPMVENVEGSDPEDFPKLYQNVTLIDTLGVKGPRPCFTEQCSENKTENITLTVECETSIVEIEKIQTRLMTSQPLGTAVAEVQGSEDKDLIENFDFDERIASKDDCPEITIVSEIAHQPRTCLHSAKFSSEQPCGKTVYIISEINAPENSFHARTCKSEVIQMDSASALEETISLTSIGDTPEENILESKPVSEVVVHTPSQVDQPENIMNFKASLSNETLIECKSRSATTIPTSYPSNTPGNVVKDKPSFGEILAVSELSDSGVAPTESSNDVNKPERHDGNKSEATQILRQELLKDETRSKLNAPVRTDPYDWAYVVWRSKGLMGRVKGETQTPAINKTTANKIEPAFSSTHDPKAFLILSPVQETQTMPMSTTGCDRAVKWNQDAGGKFGNLIQQWKQKSDTTPAPCLFSPSHSVRLKNNSNLDFKRDPKVTSKGDADLERVGTFTYDVEIDINQQAVILNDDLDTQNRASDTATASICDNDGDDMIAIFSKTDKCRANKVDILVGMTIVDTSDSHSVSKMFHGYLTVDEGSIGDVNDESDDDLEGLADPSQIANNDHEQGCACSSSAFSGNDALEEFFLPQLGMACTCGSTDTKSRLKGSDATSLERILRPWQVAFCKSFGIRKGDQLVKAHHRSASILAKAMRKWRKVHGMARVRTVSCGVALDIWARSCKYYVRSVRMQRSQGIRMIKPPSTLDFLSELVHNKEIRISVPASEHGFMTSSERASLGGETECGVEI